MGSTRQTLKHLLSAARSLDAGYYFVIVEALDCLDGPREDRAKKLLDDTLHGVEARHGPSPTLNGDLSRLLYQRKGKVQLRESQAHFWGRLSFIKVFWRFGSPNFWGHTFQVSQVHEKKLGGYQVHISLGGLNFIKVFSPFVQRILGLMFASFCVCVHIRPTQIRPHL